MFAQERRSNSGMDEHEDFQEDQKDVDQDYSLEKACDTFMHHTPF